VAIGTRLRVKLGPRNVDGELDGVSRRQTMLVRACLNAWLSEWQSWKLSATSSAR